MYVESQTRVRDGGRTSGAVVFRNKKKYQVTWSKTYGVELADHMTSIFLHRPIKYSVACLPYVVACLDTVLRLAVSGSDGMAEWSKALDRFEWLALANSRVLGSNPAQVSDCPAILPGLGGYPGRPL